MIVKALRAFGGVAAIAACLLPWAGCVGGGAGGTDGGAEPVKAPAAAGTPPVHAPATVPGAEGELELEPVVLPKDTCHAHGMPGALPWYFPEYRMVVTKITSPCVTREGKAGFRDNPQFMMMGFPCTGGGGKLNYQGHYYLPKIASYIVSTECPMAPLEFDKVRGHVAEKIGLKGNPQMLAINPFVTQFWELPSFQDSDVGFAVELTSEEALRALWHKWKEGSGFPVRLYGRENSWVIDRAFFEVEGQLVPSGKEGFRLEIRNVANLDEEGMAKVRERCQALKPRRRCDEVFF